MIKGRCQKINHDIVDECSHASEEIYVGVLGKRKLIVERVIGGVTIHSTTQLVYKLQPLVMKLEIFSCSLFSLCKCFHLIFWTIQTCISKTFANILKRNTHNVSTQNEKKLRVAAARIQAQVHNVEFLTRNYVFLTK